MGFSLWVRENGFKTITVRECQMDCFPFTFDLLSSVSVNYPDIV